MSETPAKLSLLLEHAASGGAKEIEQFLRALLESTVFIPLENSSAPVGTVGESAEAHGFVTILNDGHEVVPVFSEEHLIEPWAETELNIKTCEFKTLLWSVSPGQWIHLDPDQAVGKEMSPWEIERLQQGVDAIPEIVADLISPDDFEIEVETGTDLFPELKKHLKPLLEIYPALEEAFLISVVQGEEEVASPVLGIKHKNLPKDKLDYLYEEFKSVSEYLPRNQELMVVNLSDPTDYNAALFKETTPFYIAQKELPKQKFSVSKLFSKLKKPKKSKDEPQADSLD